MLETALFSLFSIRENNWKNVSWKLRCFPYLVLAKEKEKNEGGEVFILCPGLN